MKLGQHFLLNEDIIKKMVDSLELTTEDIVLEIGAGKGALTNEIVKYAKKFYVIEIDKRLANFLRNKFKNFNNIEVLNIDFLNFNFENILYDKIKIVGNIPYSITSFILKKIFLNNRLWDICVLMLQKEVCDKLLSKPKDRFFSKLTLFANFYTKTEFICNVSKEFFYPKPKVESCVVKFKPNLDFLNFRHRDKLFKLIDLVFKHKRKTIFSSLSLNLKTNKNLIKKELLDLGIDIKQRPQETSIETFIKITEKLLEFIN